MLSQAMMTRSCAASNEKVAASGGGAEARPRDGIFGPLDFFMASSSTFSSSTSVSKTLGLHLLGETGAAIECTDGGADSPHNKTICSACRTKFRRRARSARSEPGRPATMGVRNAPTVNNTGRWAVSSWTNYYHYQQNQTIFRHCYVQCQNLWVHL